MCNIRATSMESINYRSRHCSDYSLSFLMGFIFLLFLKWNRIHLLFFKFTRKRWFMVDQGRNDIIIPRSISVHLLQLNFINGFLMGTQKKKFWVSAYIKWYFCVFLIFKGLLNLDKSPKKQHFDMAFSCIFCSFKDVRFWSWYNQMVSYAV